MWFKRFKSGNFSVKEEVGSGRPVTDKISTIFEKVEQHRPISSYDIDEVLRELLNTRKNLTFGYHMISLAEI